MQQSTVSEAVVAGQPAANWENVDGGSAQERAASEIDCSGSPGAALNVGLTQGMVASADRLGIRVAAPNVGPTRLGAWSVGWSVGWTVVLSIGWLVSWLVSQSVGRPVDWLVVQLVGWSVGRSVGWSVGRPVSWLVGRSVDWLVGWLVGQLV
jgi:hypothetical protein